MFTIYEHIEHRDVIHSYTIRRSPDLQPSVALQYQTKTDDHSTTDLDETMSIVSAYVSMMMATCLLLSISSSTANAGSTACPQPEKGEMV